MRKTNLKNKKAVVFPLGLRKSKNNRYENSAGLNLVIYSLLFHFIKKIGIWFTVLLDCNGLQFRQKLDKILVNNLEKFWFKQCTRTAAASSLSDSASPAVEESESSRIFFLAGPSPPSALKQKILSTIHSQVSLISDDNKVESLAILICNTTKSLNIAGKLPENSLPWRAWRTLRLKQKKKKLREIDRIVKSALIWCANSAYSAGF